MICSHKSGEIASVSVVNGSSVSVLQATGMLLPMFILKGSSSDLVSVTPNACMLQGST